MRKRVGSLWLVLLVAIGCVPVKTYRVPHVKGDVRRGDRPVIGATVVWTTIEEPPYVASATTDEAGRFELSGVSP